MEVSKRSIFDGYTAGVPSIPVNRKNLNKKQDRYPCHYCGKPTRRYANKSGDANGQQYPDGRTWDHVIPKSRGGSDKPENRVISCVSCNQDKGNDWPWQHCEVCTRAIEFFLESIAGQRDPQEIDAITRVVMRTTEELS